MEENILVKDETERLCKLIEKQANVVNDIPYQTDLDGDNDKNNIENNRN